MAIIYYGYAKPPKPTSQTKITKYEQKYYKQLIIKKNNQKTAKRGLFIDALQNTQHAIFDD